jgi:hypothetical protein
MKNKVNKSVWTPVCVDENGGNGNGKAAPPRVVMAVSPGTECIRLPAPREKDPVFGLSRSYLNTLILPSVRNGNRILVRSYVLLRPGNRKGVRLIDIESLRDYVHAHVQVSHPVEAVAIPVAEQIRGELPEAA